MFQRAKNLDTAFRQLRLFTLVVVAGSLLLSGYISWRSLRLVSVLQSRVYVLADGKALEALAGDRRANLAVEARDHVRSFHRYFFSLDPDDAVIRDHISRALYLADASARDAYESLRENNYYASLVSGNVSQSLRVDSVWVSTARSPYYFRMWGEQTITRPSSVTTRSLVTEGYLREVARSDNNPHGFLIERWKTLENRDLKTRAR